MQIRYFIGEVPERGPGVALKFKYEYETKEAVKAAISRQRQHYYQQTRKPTFQAGGWTPDILVWFVATEIWPRVSEELLAKGYGLVPESCGEAFFGKQANGSRQGKEEKRESKRKEKREKKKQENHEEKREEKKQESHRQPPPRANRFQANDYELLGLTTNATAAEIKQAYRDMVEVWHPDRFTHNERLRQKAEQMMKLINAAYQRLRFVAA